jgi:hypothetical protein
MEREVSDYDGVGIRWLVNWSSKEDLFFYMNFTTTL